MVNPNKHTPSQAPTETPPTPSCPPAELSYQGHSPERDEMESLRGHSVNNSENSLLAASMPLC